MLSRREPRADVVFATAGSDTVSARAAAWWRRWEARDVFVSLSTLDETAADEGMKSALVEALRKAVPPARTLTGQSEPAMPPGLAASMTMHHVVDEGELDLGELEAAFLSDSIFARHLDELVGTSASRFRWDIRSFVSFLLARYLEAGDPDAFNEILAAKLATGLVDDLRSDDVEVSLTRPLVGLRLGGSGPLELESNLQLRALDEAEEPDVAHGSWLPPTLSRHEPPKPSFALVTMQVVPKLFGEQKEVVDDSLATARARLQVAIYALNLAGPGTFYSAALFHRSSSPFGGQRGEIGFEQPQPFDHYQLADEQRDLVKTVYAHLSHQQSGEWNVLLVALRRAATSTRRANAEDRLIDLVIAAEAMLLNDEAELRFKFGLRAAHLLGATPAERRTIFDLFDRAYVARNKVVHGTDKAQIDASLIENLGEHVRRLLRIGADAAASGERNKKASGLKTEGEWKELLVPDPEQVGAA